MTSSLVGHVTSVGRETRAARDEITRPRAREVLDVFYAIYVDAARPGAVSASPSLPRGLKLARFADPDPSHRGQSVSLGTHSAHAVRGPDLLRRRFSLVLVHGQVTFIFVVSVCLFVCMSVCLFVCGEFFSAVFDPIWIKLGHMLHVRV